MKKYKTPILIVLGLAALIVLMMLPRLTDPNRDTIQRWKSAGIECLNGHQNLVAHFHPTLDITIDGKSQTIPSETGIVSSCMSEVHTHDGSGELHVETATLGKEVTLGQFFAVWGEDINKDGYTLTATVNGEEVQDVENLVLEEEMEISLQYESAEMSTSTDSEPDA